MIPFYKITRLLRVELASLTRCIDNVNLGMLEEEPTYCTLVGEERERCK
jgi:hypothetical protein